MTRNSPVTGNRTMVRGGAPKRLMAPRRRPVLPGLVGITALLVVPAMLGSSTAADQFTGARWTADGLVAPDGIARVEIVERPPAGFSGVMARIEGVELHVPAHDVVLIGYHEASFDDALVLVPHGRLADNENTTKFTAPVDAMAGLDYTILASRGRPQAATTAVDIVLAPGVDVLSPVDGVVTDVRHYELYGQHPDVRIEIQPDAAPFLRVVLIHVRGVAIAAGDRVEAGRTKLADEANLFPFSSQIDRYTEPARFAHVHLEVKPPGSPVTD